jgi:hypothetical protein
MAIDAYSLCPGGTGKKIKFCCSDFLPELEKIDRMVEGEQYMACLKHIDHLMEQEPGRDRQCLLATKCSLLRATDQTEAARATAATFLTKHPDNPVALAEMATLAAESNNARAALELVLGSLRASKGTLSARTYQAMGLTAGALLHAGLPLPARALLQLQCDVVEDDKRPEELLSALSQAVDVPLLLRDDTPLLPPPDGAAWKDRFGEALQAVAMADWQTAADRLTALAADVPNEPIIWSNIATLRGWLADSAGSIEALHKYSVLRAAEPDGLEDAVEAEARSMFLSDEPLGDRLDMLKVVWTVKNVDLAQEACLSSPRFRNVPFNPAQFSDGETPPPKAAYMLLDRPMPASAEGLTLDTMPRLLGQALLFGRQTDREARLEVLGVSGDELQVVKDLVNATAGDAIDPQPNEEVVGHWSASQKILRAAWQPPRDASPEQLRTLADQHLRDGILKQWPNLKLGVLDGRSPREVAGDAAYRVRILAAIMVLEHWSERLPGQFDFNDLRAELGLPILGPIDSQQPVMHLPVGRIERLSVESLTDQDILTAYFRAAAFGLRPALRKFGEAILQRPAFADSDERLHVYATLARNVEDTALALQYIEQGRRAAEAKKESSASWDLMELSLRFAERNGMEAMRLIQHLQEKHIEEPYVGETLTRMLMDVGLLRPDGTPAFGPGSGAPAGMAPEAPAEEPGGLWTPDSAQPSSGGGKLWTPE